MNKRKTGFSLMMVLPFVLMLFLVGIYFIETLLTRSEYEVLDLTGVRLKYAAFSAAQLALLEVQECGMTAEDVPQHRREVEVVFIQSVPVSGKMFMGGRQALQWFDYRLSEGGVINVPAGVPLKSARGTYLYVGVDLDGDGEIGRISGKLFEGLRMNASIQGMDDPVWTNPVEMIAGAETGAWFHPSKYVIQYD